MEAHLLKIVEICMRLYDLVDEKTKAKLKLEAGHIRYDKRDQGTSRPATLIAVSEAIKQWTKSFLFCLALPRSQLTNVIWFPGSLSFHVYGYRCEH